MLMKNISFRWGWLFSRWQKKKVLFYENNHAADEEEGSL